MTIRSFTAGKGDSFLLSWERDGSPHRLLIDAGLPGTYRFIRDELIKFPVLDGIIATHIDMDHIGGLLRMVEDDKNGINEYTLYMNTPSLALIPGGDGNVGYKHGTLLNATLAKKGIFANAMHEGMNEDNTVTIAGLRFQILSPNSTILNELSAKWKADDIYNQYQIAQRTNGRVGKRDKKMPSYEEILASKEETFRWEHDIINASSIAFISFYENLSMLFLSDANPEIVYEALIRLGYSTENRLRLDFCKLSHHGSKHNTSRNLLSVIDCNLFYISTDGSGPSYHPDRETLVLLSEYARPNASVNIRILTNYRLDWRGIVTPQECLEWNITINHQEEIHL